MGHTISLAWKDNAANEDSYSIERSDNGTTGWAEIATPAANVTSYDDTGLGENVTKYYRVRAKRGSSYSDYTNIANATTGLDDLVTLATNDGAAIIYKFDENSGSFVNHVNPGTNDLTAVSGNITRNQTGVSGPDLKGALGSTTNGSGATSYGHAEGVSPSLNGNKTFSIEIVAKFPVSKNGPIITLNGKAGFSIDSGTGAVRGDLQITGQAFNSQSIGQNGVSGLDLVNTFHHIVMTWDGTNAKTYLNGTLKTNVTIGPGNTGISDSGSPVMSVFGDVDFNNNNVAVTMDFAAIYTAHVLSSTQVTAHFNRSGC